MSGGDLIEAYRKAWVAVVAVGGLGVAVAAVLTAARSSDGNGRLTTIGWWVFGVGVGLVVMYGFVIPLFAFIAVWVRDRLLNHVEHPTRAGKGLQIVEADYDGVSATAALRSLVLDGKLSVVVMPEPLGIPDPRPGVPKVLTVKYRADGRERRATKKDGEQLELP